MGDYVIKHTELASRIFNVFVQISDKNSGHNHVIVSVFVDVRDVFPSYQDVVLPDTSTWPIDEKSKGAITEAQVLY